MNGRPISPRPPITPPPKPLYLCQPFVRAALVTGKFKNIVTLPRYCDVMEWVALNMFDFYTNLNLFLSLLPESCTAATCPTLSAGPGVNYVWTDRNGRTMNLAAPTHIDYIMSWVGQLLNDQNTFPTRMGVEFPPDFPATVKQAYKLLFRIFAHIYHAHFETILHFQLEGHWNSLFAHFLVFGKEFELLDVGRDFFSSATGTGNTLSARQAQGVMGMGSVGVAQLWDKWTEMGIL